MFSTVVMCSMLFLFKLDVCVAVVVMSGMDT